MLNEETLHSKNLKKHTYVLIYNFFHKNIRFIETGNLDISNPII